MRAIGATTSVVDLAPLRGDHLGRDFATELTRHEAARAIAPSLARSHEALAR